MPEELKVTINISVSKKYAELQKTLLEAGNQILKAAQMLEDIKQAAFDKIGED